jgi:hypothetical protein
MNTDELNIVFNKNGMTIKKNDNKYQLEISLENRNIFIKNIINLYLIELFFVLNDKLFDSHKVIIHNENNATVYCVIKHFYKDLGVTQKYLCLNITKLIKDEDILFTVENAQDTENTYNFNVPIGGEIIQFQNYTVNCHLFSPHQVNIIGKIDIIHSSPLPDFVEKFSFTIISKIFFTIKQFIENYR